MKSISHPKTPSVRRRLWGGVSGGYAASATAPQAKPIVVKPAKLIGAVYKTLANKSARGQYYTGSVVDQRVKNSKLRGPRLSPKATVLHDKRLDSIVQALLQAFEMIHSFGKHQYLASLPDLLTIRRSDHVRTRRVLCEMRKYGLDRCIGRDVHRCGEPLREHLQYLRRSERLTRRMPDWPTEHEHQRLLAVASYGCGGQAKHVARIVTALSTASKESAETR